MDYQETSFAELPPFYRGFAIVIGVFFVCIWLNSARVIWKDRNRPKGAPGNELALLTFLFPFFLGLCWVVGVVTG